MTAPLSTASSTPPRDVPQNTLIGRMQEYSYSCAGSCGESLDDRGRTDIIAQIRRAAVWTARRFGELKKEIQMVLKVVLCAAAAARSAADVAPDGVPTGVRAGFALHPLPGASEVSRCATASMSDPCWPVTPQAVPIAAILNPFLVTAAER